MKKTSRWTRIASIVAVALACSLCLSQGALASSISGWGSNTHGQTNAPAGDDFVAIGGGSAHSLALKIDGSIVAWGDNTYGQTNVPTGNDFVAVCSGSSHGLALKSDGSLVSWGENNKGQLNNPAGNDFTDIASGIYFNLAIKTDGSLAAWGDNDHGQCNVPTGNDFKAIAAGYWHAVALRNDGSLITWGYMTAGVPVTSPTGNDFIAVAAGQHHGLALRSDGSLAGWGYNNSGQCNVPAGNDFVAVAGGRYWSLALKTDGSLIAWGENDYGQTTVPAGNEFVAIGNISHQHGLALEGPLDPLAWNRLELNVATPSLYVQPGENVIIDMDVLNLAQKVNGCQAMLGYSSTYFPDPTSGVVAPGGGVWDLVIYDSWDIGSGVPGEIDTAIGVDAQGDVGTDADGTVAIITLVAGSTEGTTDLIFRPDHPTDETKQTYLSDMSSQIVWPYKVDSQSIVIDGTDPTIDAISATQSGGPELTPCSSGGVAIQGQVDIVVTVSDNLSGIETMPTVTVTDADLNVTDITSTGVDGGGGVYTYSYTVTSSTGNGCATIDVAVTDRSGNVGTDSSGFDIDKNQITGTVSLSTLSTTSYSFNRDVVFKATDGGGTVLESWTVEVSFTNNTGTQIASGSYLLTEVPETIAGLSAKTAWHLRKKESIALDSDGQAVVDFVLLGGDLDGTNGITILDYSVLKRHWFTNDPEADINGDGQVQILDYSLLKENFFERGDEE